MNTYVKGAIMLALFLVSNLSRALNVLIYRGSPYQTFSARCHMQAPDSVEWARRRRYVNAIFFWQDDHCRNARQAEIDRARATLASLNHTDI